MVFRRVNITRDENIEAQEQLSHHPNVRRVLRFPWGYTLFEFYDPIFESEEVANCSQPRSEETGARLALLISEERKLLSPLYEGRPNYWQGNQLVLPLETGVYRVLEKQRGNWPWFGSSSGWESDTTIKISGMLGVSTSDSRKSLENRLSEWASWANASGWLASRRELAYHDMRFSIICSFNEFCCDPCIGLYLLLAKTRKETSVEAVGFFRPEETSPKFYEIGGTGVIS